MKKNAFVYLDINQSEQFRIQRYHQDHQKGPLAKLSQFEHG